MVVTEVAETEAVEKTLVGTVVDDDLQVEAAGVVLRVTAEHRTDGGVAASEVVAPTMPLGLSQESPIVVASNAGNAND